MSSTSSKIAKEMSIIQIAKAIAISTVIVIVIAMALIGLTLVVPMRQCCSLPFV